MSKSLLEKVQICQKIGNPISSCGYYNNPLNGSSSHCFDPKQGIIIAYEYISGCDQKIFLKKFNGMSLWVKETYICAVPIYDEQVSTEMEKHFKTIDSRSYCSTYLWQANDVIETPIITPHNVLEKSPPAHRFEFSLRSFGS